MFTSIMALAAAGVGSLLVEATPIAHQAVAGRALTPLVASSNVLTLTKKTSSNKVAARSAAYLARRINIPASNHSSVLMSFELGEEFATNVTFGTQTFEAIVDTGSSDTWLAETGFKCVDIETSAPEPESECMFGPTYNVDSTFTQIPDVNFNITYGDGEFLTGIFGTEKVTLAGITVEQNVAAVNYAAWDGDGTTSGLIGFAYPALTSEYAGTNPTVDNTAAGAQIEYNPIFKTMYTEGLVAPLFSLAILRDLEGPSGYLALGGTPPVRITTPFVSTPILITSIRGYPQTYDFYTITLDAINLQGRALNGSGAATQYIVDSGTTLNYLPTPYADAINAAFRPPAVYDAEAGVSYVDCNAGIPRLGFTIGGTKFDINPLDMILPAGTDEDGNEVCISGTVDGGAALGNLFILGDVFQKNVVSVFDIGAGMMRFAAREHYPSDDPYKV